MQSSGRGRSAGRTPLARRNAESGSRTSRRQSGKGASPRRTSADRSRPGAARHCPERERTPVRSLFDDSLGREVRQRAPNRRPRDLESVHELLLGHVVTGVHAAPAHVLDDVASHAELQLGRRPIRSRAVGRIAGRGGRAAAHGIDPPRVRSALVLPSDGGRKKKTVWRPGLSGAASGSRTSGRSSRRVRPAAGHSGFTVLLVVASGVVSGAREAPKRRREGGLLRVRLSLRKSVGGRFARCDARVRRTDGCRGEPRHSGRSGWAALERRAGSHAPVGRRARVREDRLVVHIEVTRAPPSPAKGVCISLARSCAPPHGGTRLRTHREPRIIRLRIELRPLGFPFP